jgi:hypothetical protein
MVRLKDVTVGERMRFMAVNIRAVPPDLDAMCNGQEAAIVDGLLTFRSLLARIYAAGDVLEGKDDKARFNSLYETMLLLYTCTVFGELTSREGQPAIEIDKATLLSLYKRGRLSKKTALLGHHGLEMAWLSASGDRVSQSKAVILSMTFPRETELIPAMRYLGTRINGLEPIDQGQDGKKPRPYTHFSFESISNKLSIFGKADFEAAFMGTALARDELDPLREDVVATMGKYGPAWTRLVDKLMKQYGLGCFGGFYFGQWGISFHQKRKRPFLIFAMTYERLGIELTVPVDAAEAVIMQRKTYSEPIHTRIEAFHCVQCPKECAGRNLLKIDGVSLCTGRAEARRIYLEISSGEDWDSIEAIADTAFS